jgi:hypothetical protein
LSEEELFLSLADGKVIPSADCQLKDFLKNESLKDSDVFKDFLAKVKSKNGKINLIGSYSNLSTLLKILEELKVLRNIRVFIHLINDMGAAGNLSFEDDAQKIAVLGGIMATFTEISNVYNDKAFKQLTKSIISGSKKAFKLPFYNSKQSSARVLISEKSDFIESFDGLFFFDTNINNIRPLFEYLSSDNYPAVPRFLTLLTLFFTGYPSVGSVISCNYFNHFNSISIQKKMIIITETSQRNLMRKAIGDSASNCELLYVAASDGKQYLNQRQNILSKIVSILKKSRDDYDYIFIDSPLLIKTASIGDFSDCVESVRLLDKFLAEMYSLLQKEDILIVSSLYGCIEKVDFKDDYPLPRALNKSDNLLPFVVVQQKIVKNTIETFKFPISSSDLLSPDGDLTLICKTIKKYLNII